MKKYKHKQQRFKVDKNLTYKEAYKQASKKATRDFRGFCYDAKTGNCILT